MNLKRKAILLLCVILIFTLCACGSSNKKELNAIKEELIGIYVCSTETYGRSIGFFEDGTFYEYYEMVYGTSYEKEGTWEIQRDKIILTDTEGSTHYFTYEYHKDSGQLTLYYNGYDTPYIKYDG